MNFENFALGKGEYKPDERTLSLAAFFMPDVPPHPTNFDFDKRRRTIPVRLLGNDKWGNCVIVGRANHLLRLERIEQRRTIRISEENVIDEYRMESMRQFGNSPQTPGDPHDRGLIVLDAIKNWRNYGWVLGKRTFQVEAYGELDPSDRGQLRQAIYFLHGIHMGFWLPRAAMKMTDRWHYEGQNGPEWKPGSWGGHLVYAKRYDLENLYVLTWGQEIPVSNEFVEHYCDEAWAIVDSLDSWRTRATIDVPTLLERLRGIGAQVK